MKYLISIVLLVLSISSNAQNLRQQKLELPDGSRLIYQTINNKLNGIYSIDKDGVNILRGNYVNEKRVGNWYIFNNDKTLFARYNYDVNKTLYLDAKMLALATINIKSGDEEINSKASVSFPLISIEQYIPLVTRIAEQVVPVDDLYKLDQKSVYIIAKVDADGNASYYVNYEIKTRKVEYKLNVNKDPFIIDWIVAHYDGKNYPSEFIIKSKLSSNPSDTNHKRINWF